MHQHTLELAYQLATLLKIPSDHTPLFIFSAFSLINQDKEFFNHILDIVDSLQTPFEFADFLDTAIFNPLSINTNAGRILTLINTSLFIFDHILVNRRFAFLPVLKFKLFIVLNFTCKSHLSSNNNYSKFFLILQKQTSDSQLSIPNHNQFDYTLSTPDHIYTYKKYFWFSLFLLGYISSYLLNLSFREFH